MPSQDSDIRPFLPVKERAILIIEDHDGTRDALATLLSNAFEGWALLTAGSAERGLEVFHASSPAVVIMDASLPGMDGFEGTRLIKARRPATVVIMHSMHTDDVYRDRAVAAGASAFVSKICAADDLVATIRRLL